MSDTAQQPPTAPRADVIHDIGYRHYEGPRLGRSYATRSLYTLSLRGSFGLGRSVKSKILPMALLAVICLPALIIVAVTVYTKLSKYPDTASYPNYLSIMQFVIAVFVAAQAPVALSRDLRFMTLPLYFSRPLTSRDYVQAKFGAMASAVFVLTGLPMLIMWIGSMLASMDFGYNLEHFGYGLVAAAFYSLLYAGIGLVISSVTPRRGFGVAAIIAVLLISEAVAGIIYAVLDVHGHSSGAGWALVISPSSLVATTVDWLFGLSGRGNIHVPSDLGGFVFLAEILLVAAASYGLLVRRYRKI
ncbi:ABC transporter permease [Streptacidiphilus carbonis]|jgi:ABC-2 type transport system permease protein|uniref:ABC transporter permease n=1 Tax=Streptacidiphilus carbonis TaxID=105422 RepID=UPI0005A75B8D|nr:ABC transporter permease [Streptacidiphilus carbonis]